MNMVRSLVLFVLFFAASPAFAWTHGSAAITPPTADVVCNLATGIATGVGAGTCATTTAICDGNNNDDPAFTSFNNWAVNTWQASHTGLIELDLPAGVCVFKTMSGGNNITRGIKHIQVVGYGTTLSDNAGTGNGFFLGAGGIFFDNAHTARFATITAGATSIMLLDTLLCSLYNSGDWALLAGIDPQGFGDPPNPQIYEYIQINSVAACAGSGVITLATSTAHAYKSTWPLYNAGSALNSDNGGPATIYALDQRWVTNQAFYGLTIDQAGAQTNSNGQHMAFYDLTVPLGQPFCPIPSQNSTWTITNGSIPTCRIEIDKIVESVTFTNVTIARIIFQSGSDPQQFTCNNCTIGPLGVSGSAGNSTYNGGSISELQLGALAYGNAGSFTANNTVISSFVLGGASQSHIEARGIWASGILTVPFGMTVSAAANNGSGLIRLTVNSTAGWTTGIFGDGSGDCQSGSPYAVTVIDGTHVDLQGSTWAPGTVCTGGFSSLPLTWAAPGGYVYFSAGQSPLGPILQVADLAVGANNATVVSFNQNGSPYAGGFPVMPGSTWSITTHMAPSWTCLGCTGAPEVTDVTGTAMAGLPFGSYATRILTAGTSDEQFGVSAFGALTELDITVTAACGGASNAGFESMFITTLGSVTVGTWNPTVNAAIASATPRKIMPTSSSGAQSGDVLTTPGANTWLVRRQMIPLYSNLGNCGSASTTITVKTDQGVTFP